MMSASARALLVIPAYIVGGCVTRPAVPATTASAVTPVTIPTPPRDVDPALLDRRVDPCANFYRYACGGWIDRTEIPPDRPAWSRSFSEINERNLANLRGILESYAAHPPGARTEARKLGDFYRTCMEEAKAETASASTLEDHMRPLTSLRSWPSLVAPANRAALARLIASLHLAGVNALFAFGSQQDFADARQVIGAADQGGLGLPDRDYYLSTDAKMVQIREAYRAHVAQMLELDGVPAGDAHRRANAVLEFETALARASMPRAEHRDPARIYHRLDRAGLVALAPNFDWDAYFLALAHPEIRTLNVLTPDFFAALDGALADTRPADLESYLGWHLIAAAAPALGRAFVDESFRFRAASLTGEAELLPRWKRCLAAVDTGMGQALGKPFVAATFSAEAKQRAQALVGSIEGAFRSDLGGLPWMDEPTRAHALLKLDRVYNQIGYPWRWRDYSALIVGTQSDLENRMNAAAFELERDLGKIGHPVDRSDWEMSPQTVNAYYDPSKNEMVFPAGILQPPFFNRMASAELDDGGIGVVMGHELTHGFDDEGRKFDADGDLRDWWTPEVGKAFEARVACVVDQYDTYSVAGGLHLNGRLTAGENIADLGGLRLAHEVFVAQSGLSNHAASRDGLTNEQRFFVAFAQAWCAKRRDPYARMLVTVDPHAPPEYRVNGAVSDLEAFGHAFACQRGAPMAPLRRCRVW